MESVIVKSLSNNNDERQQATKHICELLKNPSAFQEFWSVVVRSSNPDARQASAMYFYRMIQKKKKWLQVPNEIRNGIKASMLDRIHLEPEKKVKTVIVQSAGQIALLEPNNWPELFKLLEETVAFEGLPEMRELGLFMISILTEHTPVLFELHVTSLLNLFGSILTKPENYSSALGYLTVLSMKNFLLYYPKKDKLIAQSFEYLMPSVLEVVKAQSSRNRPDRSVECLLFFDALLESYPRIITLNLKNIIEGLLRAAIFLNVDEISCRMLDVISTIICNKTKKIAKDDAVLQMLARTLYEIISSKPQKEISDHYDVFNGDVNVINAAVDLIDTLATEIEPELLLKHMMPILDNAAVGENIYDRKAVYIILGVLVEHCPRQLGSGGVDRIILFMKEGLNSDIPLLLNGALFTLWRFIEYFKPDINVYMLEFVTPLLQLLNNLEGNFKKIEGHLVQKIFFILSECCETLETAIEPVLPFMVPILLSVVKFNTKIHYRELAINVIGQAGVATKKSFRDYFPMILEVLRPFLVNNLPDDQLPLQVQTFDTLGTLFKNLYVKGDEFQLVDDVLNLTLCITEQKNSGELRSGLYSMLSDCSEFMKEKMENYIPRILKLMNISFRELDSHDGEPAAPELNPQIMNLDIDSKDRKAIPCKDLKIIEEKEEALMALGKIALNTGSPFQPYLSESYMICLSLSTHENTVIRAAAMEALANTYIALKLCYPNESASGIPEQGLLLISKFFNVVKEDENVDVVYAVLEGYQKILQHIPQIVEVVVQEVPMGGLGGPNASTNGSLIAGVVKMIITEKCLCQKLKMREDDSDDDEDEDEDENDEDANKDEEIEDNYTAEDLIVAAEELIPLLGDALNRPAFLFYFGSYQRHLLKLLEKHQPAEVRESTSATLALCMKYLADYMNVFAVEFAPILPTLMKDNNDSVRNNIAFCLSQMILHGKETMFPYFGDLSTSLVNWLQAERCCMVVDNICGAIGSMIISNKELLLLDNIVPIFFQYLPLREDFSENAVIFKAFNSLFENTTFKLYLVKAVEVVLTSSINKQVTCDGARQEAVKLFELISKCYSNEKEIILRNLPEELRSHFVAAL